jgi:hypothetical protein
VLVAHQKKGQKFKGQPSSELEVDNDDISGAGDMKNMANNIMFVQRFKTREREVAQLYDLIYNHDENGLQKHWTSEDKAKYDKLVKMPHGRISLTKQRGGAIGKRGRLGMVHVYYDSISGQYQKHQDTRRVYFK